MDPSPLVNSDIEIESKVIFALSRAKIPITAVDWSLVGQEQKFQLIVVTPLVDKWGPRETYSRIFKVLSEAGMYQSNLIRKLSVKSPDDPFAKALVAELKRTNEGALHIVRNSTRSGVTQYTVVFAPYVGSGGAIPSKRIAGNVALRNFLEKRIGIHPSAVDQAMAELAQTESVTIFNVQLSQRRLKNLELAA